MFIGYQNEKIALIAQTKQELIDAPCMTFTDIVETNEPVEMIDCEYYLGETAINSARANNIRKIRNEYLEKYIDPIVSNNLRWAEMDAETRNEYTDYRRYLLDITENENFPNVHVMTFEEFNKK